jgi:hypothetical protein
MPIMNNYDGPRVQCVAGGEGAADHSLRELAHLALIESAFIGGSISFLVQCSKAETLSPGARPPPPRRCRPETGYVKPQTSYFHRMTALALARTRSRLADAGSQGTLETGRNEAGCKRSAGDHCSAVPPRSPRPRPIARSTLKPPRNPDPSRIAPEVRSPLSGGAISTCPCMCSGT